MRDLLPLLTVGVGCMLILSLLSKGCLRTSPHSAGSTQ